MQSRFPGSDRQDGIFFARRTGVQVTGFGCTQARDTLRMVAEDYAGAHDSNKTAEQGVPKRTRTAGQRDAGTLTCWAVSDGRRGMANQVQGLAEAVARHLPNGLTLDIKPLTIALKAPYRWLPYSVLGQGWADPVRALPPSESALASRLRRPEAWPDLLIGCGRLSVAFAVAARTRTRNRPGGACLTAQTQDPRVPVNRFDLVFPPAHDGLTGPNVVPLLGAPNRITPAALEEGHALFASRFADLHRPLVGVLIGGSSKSHTLTPERTREIARHLKDLAVRGIGLVITTSRRTGAENEAVLARELEGTSAYIWDGTGENPYFGLLAHADHLIVTADSTNMLTEAAATGKPVHIAALDGGSAKFDRLIGALKDQGIARPFSGTLDHWTYAPLRETDRAGAIVAGALLERKEAARKERQS